MRRFPRVCDPADCKRCDVPEGSAECLIREAQICVQLMSAPVAQAYRHAIEQLSLDMIEEAGAVSESERLRCEHAVILPFRRGHTA